MCIHVKRKALPPHAPSPPLCMPPHAPATAHAPPPAFFPSIIVEGTLLLLFLGAKQRQLFVVAPVCIGTVPVVPYIILHKLLKDKVERQKQDGVGQLGEDNELKPDDGNMPPPILIC